MLLREEVDYRDSLAAKRESIIYKCIKQNYTYIGRGFCFECLGMIRPEILLL